MKAYTIAIGEQYQALAAMTVPLMEQYLGMSVQVVTEGDPWLEKLSLLERESEAVVFIDADVVMRGWDWDAVNPAQYNAVAYGIAPDAYTRVAQQSTWYSSGVWIAPPLARDCFTVARGILESEAASGIYPNLREEFALNRALTETGYPVNALPTTFNASRVVGSAYCIHYAGMAIDHKLTLITEHLAQLNG